MPRYKLDGVTLEAEAGWVDVTENGEPLTMTRGEEGLGALQFSLAIYKGGEVPNPAPQDLLAMVRDFGVQRELGPGFDETCRDLGSIKLAAASHRSQGYFLRAWYVSDGANFALVTYTSEWYVRERELAQAERIVASLQFRGGAA